MNNPAQSAEYDPRLDPRNAENPQHRMYKQIEDGVSALSARVGGVSDEQNAQTTMSLFNRADQAGLKSVDHLELNRRGTQNDAGTLAVMVQGQDPYNPANRNAHMNIAEAANQRVDASLQNYQVRAGMDAPSQAQDRQQMRDLDQAQQQPNREQPSIKM
ncbi:MAG: hypothetical protein IT473_16220 [Lysobacter sp.]|nr:hypothetical protein [Lysobacter sp.]